MTNFVHQTAAALLPGDVRLAAPDVLLLRGGADDHRSPPGPDRRVRRRGGGGPRDDRTDHASDPPPKAMESKPLGNHIQGPDGGSDEEEEEEEAGASVLVTGGGEQQQQQGSADPPAAARRTSDHDSDTMTKTNFCPIPCQTMPANDLSTPCAVHPTPRNDPGYLQSPPGGGGQSFPGTIPKLIITREPSPSRSQGSPPPYTGLGLGGGGGGGPGYELQPDEESPCSDSGCGGSPALIRSPRKLSSSSSVCLSSASSFEESEDDFTASDIESSLSPGRCQSVGSPDDGTCVSVPLLGYLISTVFTSLVMCAISAGGNVDCFALIHFQNHSGLTVRVAIPCVSCLQPAVQSPGTQGLCSRSAS